jgi:hypothetical protein
MRSRLQPGRHQLCRATSPKPQDYHIGRTDPAGLTGTTWPVTSQSNRWRIAASRCLKLGAASSRVPVSIQVATCTGWMAPIDGTPAAAR